MFLNFQIVKLAVVDLSANFLDTQTQLLILNLYNWKLEKLSLWVHSDFLGKFELQLKGLKQNIATLKDPNKGLFMPILADQF